MHTSSQQLAVPPYILHFPSSSTKALVTCSATRSDWQPRTTAMRTIGSIHMNGRVRKSPHLPSSGYVHDHRRAYAFTMNSLGLGTRQQLNSAQQRKPQGSGLAVSATPAHRDGFEQRASANVSKLPQHHSTTTSAPCTPTPQSAEAACNQSAAISGRRGFLLATGAGVAAVASAGALLPGHSRANALVIDKASPTIVMKGSAGGLAAANLEARVHEFTLANGMHFICLPRNNAPVVSCHTYANVGAWDEVDGQTGLAHLLEHMAFKGSPRLGSKDFKKEEPLLAAMDEVFYEQRELARAGSSGSSDGSSSRLQALSEQLAKLQAQADALSEPNAFGAMLQQQGGVGLNASTSQDQTRYYVSLPANKLELWMALEAQRFRAPVFRGLYSEKKVVEEERQLRVDNSPSGAFTQAYIGASLGNNYRRPVIGYAEDVAAVGRRELQAFFSRYYGPPNLTVTVVGDVDPGKLRQMAERYWGDWRAPAQGVNLPKGPPSREQGGDAGSARPQAGVRELRAPARAGPAVLLGFYRPSLAAPGSGVALEVLSDVLAGGRTSRLYTELVLPQRLLSASVAAGYPGDKRAGMVLVYGTPAPGDSVDRAASLIESSLARVVDGGISAQELARVQRSTRAQLLATAQSNSAMAAALASYHNLTGSWRGLLEELEALEQLRPAQVLDAAQATLVSSNCFKGFMLSAKA